MTRATNRERELLLEMRRTLSPTRADQDRIGLRLLTSIAQGVSVPYEPVHAPRRTAAESALSQGIRGLGAQAVAASLVAAVGFGAGYFTGRSATANRPPLAPVASTLQSSPAVTAPAKQPDTRPEAPAIAASSRVVEKAAPLQPTASSSALSAQTLSDEARELQRVDRALRNGMPVLALGILRELDDRIPRGVLLEERAAARLMARCQNGDPEAPQAAEAWLERHPRSVYLSRLQAACDAAKVPGGGQDDRAP